MKRFLVLLCALTLVFGVMGTASGYILWDWSFCSEAGQFVTDGDIPTPGTYNMIDFSVTQSTVGGTIGSLSGGEYIAEGFSTFEPYSFAWDGNSVTNWLSAGTNVADWWPFQDVTTPYLFYFFGYSLNTSSDPTFAAYHDSGTGSIDLAFGMVNVAPVPEPPDPVGIDIMPRTCPNECPIKGGGFVEVAILGTLAFDVNDIDIASVRLEGVAPIRSRLQDKSSPVVPPPTECECTTEGRDGFIDLCLKFDKKEILSALGEVDVGDSFVLTLTGSLNDGTPIEGRDCIVMTQKGKKN